MTDDERLPVGGRKRRATRESRNPASLQVDGDETMNKPAFFFCATTNTYGAIVLAAVLSGCGGDSSDDQGPTVAQLAATCASMVGKVIAGATVTAATRIEPVANISTAGFCKVNATRAPFLDIEVDVPDNWSGRYWQNGGGGFNGTIPSAVSTSASGVITALNPALAQKAAVYAASNGGNRASVPAEAAPAVWANGTANGAASATDYDYLSVGTTLAVAKGVIAAFYGTPAKYRYFNGCSNGGREAYIAAQRWPDDFDGIVSGCETEDMTGQTAAWLDLGRRAGTAAAPTAAQYRAAYAAAVASCDAQDGLTDAYLENPAACNYDPGLLLCGLPTANADPALCLTAPQVQTLKDLMSPLKLADGTVVYAGFTWSDFSTFGPSFGVLGSGFALLATNDASWLTPTKQATFHVDAHYALIGNGLRRVGAEHDLPAIASFVASGKKLISWHDAGDNLLSTREHARNDVMLTQLIKNLGVADPTTNTRLFAVPSSTHSAGSALTQVDWATAIMNWVEQGTAPTQLTYTFTPAGAAAARNLPVCLYPKYPRYNGTGDVNAAANYTCT
jgi:feruloyl esterase